MAIRTDGFRNISLSLVFAIAFIASFAFASIKYVHSDMRQGAFVAGLTGNQEAPTINTTAQGSAIFIPVLDSRIAYSINATNLTNATGGGLYIGVEGKKGPQVVNLSFPLSNPGVVNGSLSLGNITSSQLEGPMQGKKTSDLLDLMLKGDVYVNIKTQQNPEGEIRGQVGFGGVDETGTGVGESSVPPQVHEVD